VEIKEIFK